MKQLITQVRPGNKVNNLDTRMSLDVDLVSSLLTLNGYISTELIIVIVCDYCVYCLLLASKQSSKFNLRLNKYQSNLF